MQGIPALSSSRRLKARIILSSPHDSPAGGYQQEWPQPWAIPATTRADYSAKGEPEQVMCSNGLTLLRVLVGATDPNFRPEKLPYVDPPDVPLPMLVCGHRGSPTVLPTARLPKRPVDGHNYQPLYQHFNSPITPQQSRKGPCCQCLIAFAWYNEDGERSTGGGEIIFLKKRRSRSSRWRSIAHSNHHP